MERLTTRKIGWIAWGPLKSLTTDKGASAAASAPADLALWLLVAVCAILPIGELIKAAMHPQILFPDFFGLWSFGRYTLSHAPASIYNDQAMAAYQQSLGLPRGGAFYPFPYPPWILLLLAPLAALPYGAAHGLWLAGTVAAFGSALTIWRWRPIAVALFFLVPSTVICVLVGQNGFLSATLMIGGVRLLRKRPILAGVLLASLAYKPQLALTAPFLLLFGQHWRAMFSAAVWTMILCAATTLVLGPAIWTAWLANMHEHAAALSNGRTALLDMMPTATSAVLLLGGGALMAHGAQVGCALFAVLALWRVRDRSDLAAQAVFPLAAMLAAPYAFDYDLPAVSGMLLALLATNARASEPQRPSLVLLMAGLMAPGVLFARQGVIAAGVPLLFILLIWALARPLHADLASDCSAKRLPRRGSALLGALAGRVLQRGRLSTAS